jgi:hypothetical protein
MKILGLILLVWIGSGASVWALLGEDEAQAASRYGQPVNHTANTEQDRQTRIYEYRGYRVIVTFEHGKSTAEGFFKLGGAGPFTDENIKEFLQNHGAGQAWRELPTPTGMRLWVRPGAIATYGVENDKAQFAVMAYAGSADEIVKAAVTHAPTTPQP